MIIKLDKKRKLKFTMKSLIEFEERTGLTFLEGITKLQSGKISLKIIFDFLWAGLLADDPALTQEELLEIYDNLKVSEQPKLVELIENIGVAFGEYWGESEKKNA
jgi:hypothetical protein